jgi:hypothetical protein
MKIRDDIFTAARALVLRVAEGARSADCEKWERIIGWTTVDDDPIRERLDKAILQAEDLCRATLSSREG